MTKPATKVCEECLGDRYIGGVACRGCGGDGAIDVPIGVNLCVAELEAADEAVAIAVFRSRAAITKARRRRQPSAGKQNKKAEPRNP